MEESEEQEMTDEQETTEQEHTVDELVEELDEKDEKMSTLRQHMDEMENKASEMQEEIDALEKENGKLKKMVMDKKDSLKKQRERTETKISAAKKETVRDIVAELTDVRRSLSKAVDSPNGEDITGGVEKTLDLLDKKLKQNGIEIIEPEDGEDCEPTKHEVISTRSDSDYSEGSIVEVHTVGFMYENTVLTPAKVTTSE